MDRLSKGRALLALGRDAEFRDWAMRQPMMFSGLFESEDIANAKLEQLTRRRSPGQLFYVEEHDDGWCVMARLQL